MSEEEELVKVTARININAVVVEPVEPKDDGKFHYEFEEYEIQHQIENLFHEYWPDVQFDIDLDVDFEDADEDTEMVLPVHDYRPRRYALPLSATDWDNLVAGNIIIFKGVELGKVPGEKISADEKNVIIELSRPMHNSQRSFSNMCLVKYPPGERNCPGCGMCFYPKDYEDYSELCYNCQHTKKTGSE
jgi:hypothetical protein